MASKRSIPIKKIHRSAGSAFVLISKEAMEKLKWRAQDPDCQVIEIADPVRHRIIFQLWDALKR